MEDQSKVPGLPELLWTALLRVESNGGFYPNDPLFGEFRHNVLQLIAALEIAKSQEETDEAKCA